MLKMPVLIVSLAASWMTFWSPAYATDLNGPWATDGSACNRVFVKNGDCLLYTSDAADE